MSTITKLEIRGIRGFSPITEQDGTIEFYSPLTIIVGANGCGKTTIIESLKYACCGELPPGVRNGQAFVNDPSMTSINEVKASIKLKFLNRRGNVSTAIRSLQLSRKRNKMEFKALDSVLQIGEGTDRTSISMKCSELNEQMPMMLGASASVLDNVIFCHQEDSDWPLQEGSVLKKRFDDIFDSSRYTKALDELMILKKKLASQEIDQKLKKQKFHEVLMMFRNANEKKVIQEDLIAEIDEDSRKVSETLDRARSRLNDLQIENKKYQEYEKRKNDMQAILKTHEQRVNIMESNFTDKLDCSDDDLQHQLNNFEDKIASISSQCTKIKKELDGIEKQKKRLTIEIQENCSQIGKLATLRSQYDEATKRLEDFARTLSKKYGWKNTSNTFSGRLNPNDMTFEMMLRNLDDMCRNYEQVSLKDVEEAQKKVQSCDVNCREAQQKWQEYYINRSTFKKDVERMTKEIQELKQRQASMVTLKIKWQEAQQAYDDQRISYDEAFLNLQEKSKERSAELKSLNERVHELEENIESQDKILQQRNLIRQDQAVLQAHEKTWDENLNHWRSSLEAFFQLHDRNLNDFWKRYPHLIGWKDRSLETVGISSTAVVSSGKNNMALQSRLKPPFLPSEFALLKSTLEQESWSIQGVHDNLQQERNQLEKDVIRLQGVWDHRYEELLTLKNNWNQRFEQSKQRYSRIETLLIQLNGIRCHPLVADFCEPWDLSNWAASCQTIPSGGGSNSGASSDLRRNGSPLDLSSWVEASRGLLGDLRDLETLMKVGKLFAKRFSKAKSRSGGNNCPLCTQCISSNLMTTYEANLSQLLTLSNRKTGTGDGDSTIGSKDEENTVHKLMESWELYHNELQALDKEEAAWKVYQDDVSQLSLDVQQAETEYHEAQSRFDNQEKDWKNHQQLWETWKLLPLQFGGSWQDQYRRLEADEIKLMEERKRFFACHSSSMTSSIASNSNSNPTSMNSLLGSMSSLDNLESLDSLENRLRSWREEKDSCLLRREKIRLEEDKQQQRIASLKSFLTEKEKLSIEAHHAYQAGEMGHQQLQELEMKLKTVTMEMEAIDKPLAHWDAQRTFLEEEKKKKERECQRIQSHRQQDIDNRRNEALTLQELSVERDRINFRDDNGQLEESKNRLVKQMDGLEKQAHEGQEQERQLDKTLQCQSDLKKNLETNRLWRQEKRELDRLRRQMQEAFGNVSDDSVSVSRQEWQRLYDRAIQEESKNSQKWHELNGGRKVAEKVLEDIERELRRPEMLTVEKDYRESQVSLEAIKLVINDVELYAQALDEAIQRFHSSKIREINLIIKELWQLIYQGNDIEYIEIESGPESATGLTVSARSAKSYNYRIIMRKGNNPLEMRGRCSAGQRVLACIVIRLALAETFGIDCGILALDEPTTNLDEENKQSLAQALVRIIHSRARQKNFQLVCITHDEDFVHQMNMEMSNLLDCSKPEYYFRLYREVSEASGTYFSRSERIPWDDM